MTPPPHPAPWFPDAIACLDAAIREDIPAIQAAAHRLIRTYGPGIVATAILAWIDTTIQRCGLTYGEPVRMKFFDIDSGDTTENSDELPAPHAWAARLINARLAVDKDAYRAILRSVPEGEDAAYVNACLMSCARSINYYQSEGTHV